MIVRSKRLHEPPVKVNIDHLNPVLVLHSLLRNRYLLTQLIKRDVLLKYRGAFFGVLWAFLNPLIQLAIFAFVFGQIFQARWPQQPDGMPFWLMLYAGLIVFNLFGETVGRAPTTVRGYPAYVKKIIFPVEILPLVPLGNALVHAAFNFLILCAALAWVGHLESRILLLPPLIVPVLLLAMGCAWFLAAWGVFIKDMSQIVPLFVQMLLFLSPVFYPASAVPAALRPLYALNPLGVVVEAARATLLGQPVVWSGWLGALTAGLAAALLGMMFFTHARDEFADAL